MSLNRLIKRQCRFEGFSAIPYRCTEGYWTQGYGMRVWNGRRVNANSPKISKKEALVNLKASLIDSMLICEKLYKNYTALPQVQQDVLVHMAYQLGNRLAGFTELQKAIESDPPNLHWACIEMEDSRWFKQTPRVANACIDAIRANVWLGEWA
jgi:GH24 family phage-related lysozyme (muramidase)